MVEDSPLASHWHCSALRSWMWIMWSDAKTSKNPENTGKRTTVIKDTHIYVCFPQFGREDDEKNFPHDLRFTVMADCIRIGRQGKARQRAEAQFASTFSNRVFSPNKPATMACDDGKRKFNLSRVEPHVAGIFPMFPKGWNPGLKWSGSPRSLCPLLHAVRWHKEKEPYSPC